jgi:hypothetical protein
MDINFLRRDFFNKKMEGKQAELGWFLIRIYLQTSLNNEIKKDFFFFFFGSGEGWK